MSSSEQPGRTVDNVCGAVSRMIMSNRSAVPLDKVMFIIYFLLILLLLFIYLCKEHTTAARVYML
jgi:preprotein translocase subunit SecG